MKKYKKYKKLKKIEKIQKKLKKYKKMQQKRIKVDCRLQLINIIFFSHGLDVGVYQL